jgi:hypothetical protein
MTAQRPSEPELILPRDSDARRFAPATRRNREPIFGVLCRALAATKSGTVLEVASGSGEHAVYFAPRLPQLHWQPSDLEEENLLSIASWRVAQPASNLLSPIMLDAEKKIWPLQEAAAVVNINMIHIAPWAVCLGLLAGAARILPPAGVLYLYGPYKRGGRHTAPSNESFDAMLRQKNPAWGVRDLEEVVAEAAAQGLRLQEVVEMPVNNLSVILIKSDRP